VTVARARDVSDSQCAVHGAVPSAEVSATFARRHRAAVVRRYDARPRVKVTGVLSPERGPRDTRVREVVSLTSRSVPVNGFFGGTGLIRSTQYTSEAV